MKIIFSTLIIIVALLVVSGNVKAAPMSAAIENWAYNYPDAAFELWSWSKEHPKAAQKLSAWNETNHERSKVLVSWAITHPGKSIDVFMGDHTNWTNFENLIKNHRSATKELLAWCSQYPGAARALMKFSRQVLASKN